MEVLAEKFYLKGRELLLLRKYDKAMGMFAQALKFRALYPEAYIGIAECFRGKGDLDRSSQFLAKAAETLVWLDRHDEAENLYKHATKIDPRTPNPYKTVADHLRQQKRPKVTAALYERAARLSPKDPDVAVALARSLVESGQKEKAAQAMQHVMAESDVPEDLRGVFVRISDDAEQKRGQPRRLEVLETTNGFDGVEKRRAQRVPLADYAAKMPKFKEFFPVIDLSVLGFAFKPSGEAFAVGQEVSFDLLTMGDVRAKKVTSVVRRVGGAAVGCEFRHLDDRQRKALVKILPKNALPGAS
jgi:hypothetical protein